MTVEIRAARQRELPRVGDLTAQAYLTDDLLPAGDGYLAELRDAVRRAQEASVLVAVEDDAVVGSVTLARYGGPYAEVALPGEAEIRMLAVDPDSRNQGVGELLMRAAVREAFAGGAERVVLSTTDRMVAAQRMYERMGMRREPDRDTVLDGEQLRVFVLDRPHG
jgi:ribosomal protein S18 acetylase RimI-like enzyme